NPGVLPEPHVLVVDEAHELADRVRSQGTVSLSAGAEADEPKPVEESAAAGEDLAEA
ncbi:ATP-dependent DNA helicase, partial [human gut metagenome]